MKKEEVGIVAPKFKVEMIKEELIGAGLDFEVWDNALGAHAPKYFKIMITPDQLGIIKKIFEKVEEFYASKN